MISFIIRVGYNYIFYPLLFLIVSFFAPILKNLRKPYRERFQVFKKLKSYIKLPGRRSILVHASSMGEFEHIKPLLGKLKSIYPNSKCVVTFFSPSGYNHVKSFKGVDLFLYLPFDFSFVMKRFYKIVRPDALIIAKYDLWPNMIWEAEKQEIPVFIVNGALTSQSNRFKGFSGVFHKEIYKHLTEVWVSSESDVERFQQLAPNVKISITGDTKFDQVIWRRENSKRSTVLNEKVVKNKKVFIAGSIWPEDWNVLIPAFNKLLAEYKDLVVILVPHEPTEEHLSDLESNLTHSSIRFSRIDQYKNESFIIINRIGILASLYQKGDFAYVGGSFKQNIHNVLEPAVFGIPVFYGPVHRNSFEEVELQEVGGSIVIENENEFYNAFKEVYSSQKNYKELCQIANIYTHQNQGATDKVLYRLKQYLS